MKGVVLAAGLGTRLLPLTQIINKQMLPIGQYPMIYYSIKKLADNGIANALAFAEGFILPGEKCDSGGKFIVSGGDFNEGIGDRGWRAARV